MNARGRSQVITSQVITVATAGLLAVATGCARSEPGSSSAARPGVTGTSYLVSVSRQPGGTVTSADGRINCGTRGAACGPESFAWDQAAVLTATADTGFMFGTWAGDCTGRTANQAGQYVCVLDTARSGADKYVLAVFGEVGRTQHTNFDDPGVHGPAFMDWIAKRPDAFDCGYCHGSTYNGLGIAPSCNACHARNQHPSWQTECSFCHDAPPATPGHAHLPAGDATRCVECHPTTADASGNIVAGGTHMNGQLDGGGHPDTVQLPDGTVVPYASPQAHGRDFFAVASGPHACRNCHGQEYELVKATVNGQQSCSSCHALTQGTEPGWTTWKDNCSFCHGVRDGTTRGASYDVALHPTWSAPPDAISQRLTGAAAPERTGAHAKHLASTTYTTSVRCASCHEVPASLTHISGRDVRAAVVLDAPGPSAPDPLGYDAATGTCSTHCHGANRSREWTWLPTPPATGLACDGCHAVPPDSAAHLGLEGADLGAECSGCHPNTISSTTGAIDLAAGGHINGTVDRPDGHEPVDGVAFTSPSVHGVAFLDHLAGVAGAQDCASCHGGYGNCDECHSSVPPSAVAWVSWDTNCTFCHGTRTPSYEFETTPATQYLASPPDAVSQRLDGAAVPTRTGKHRVHLRGQVNTSGATVYAPLPCAGCHPVPRTLDHVSADRRAHVEMTVAGAFPDLTPLQHQTLRTPLPDPISTYVPGTGDVPGTCSNNYCHGSTLQGGTSTDNLAVGAPSWTTALTQLSCASCHGNPPPTGGLTTPNPGDPYCPSGCSLHQWHNAALPDLGYDQCSDCHAGNVHVNGFPDIGWGTGVSGEWDPVAKTCAMACHSDPAPRAWLPSNYAPTVSAGPDATLPEGQTLSVSATFSDPDAGDTHTASVSWGDGATTPAVVSSGTVTASHAYGDNGVYTADVCVTDNEGGIGCDILVVTVTNVRPTIVPIPDQTVTLGSPVNFVAQFSDPGWLDTHVAEVDWDDGILDELAVTYVAPGSGTVAASHVYTAAGDYSVLLCVTDDDTGNRCDAFLVAVVTVLPPP